MGNRSKAYRVGGKMLGLGDKCPCGSGMVFGKCCYGRAKVVRRAVDPFPLGVGVRFKSGVVNGVRLMALELSLVKDGLVGTQDVKMTLKKEADPREALAELLVDVAGELMKHVQAQKQEEAVSPSELVIPVDFKPKDAPDDLCVCGKSAKDHALITNHVYRKRTEGVSNG